MSKHDFINGDRVRSKEGIFVVAASWKVVVHGRLRRVLSAADGRKGFADECELLPPESTRESEYEAKMKAEEAKFASCIWEFEVNRPKPLMRAEAERNITEHLSAFRAFVEQEWAEHHKVFR